MSNWDAKYRVEVMADERDSNPEYWSEYTNLQNVKHSLIREYLNGWFPKLGSWAGRILYIDTHAGRGRHQQGEAGSPLVALHTFLNHSYTPTLLQKCSAQFVFIERDQTNAELLSNEIEELGKLPDRVSVKTVVGDSFNTIQRAVAGLQEKGQKLSPTFVFVDPYGFKIPGSVLRSLMQFDRVELFINVIWR